MMRDMLLEEIMYGNERIVNGNTEVCLLRFKDNVTVTVTLSWKLQNGYGGVGCSSRWNLKNRGNVEAKRRAELVLIREFIKVW